MSYFLITTGVVPSIDDIPVLRLVAASQAQGYVSDIVADTLESADQAVTYLLDDGTQTSDTVVAEASDQIAGGVRSRPRGWDTWSSGSLTPAAPSVSGGHLRLAGCRGSMSLTTATNSSPGSLIACVQARI